MALSPRRSQRSLAQKTSSRSPKMTGTQPPTTESPQTNHDYYKVPGNIPIDTVSEEEMALIDAALAAARPSLSSAISSAAVSPSSPTSLCSSLSPTRFQQNSRSIQSITQLSKRRLWTEPIFPGDIEDAATGSRSRKKRNRVAESFLHRFRSKTGLYVSDITATEWCEKQVESFLKFGKPEPTRAMKAGIARHAVLEEEVGKRAKVHTTETRTVEDKWALKFMKSMTGIIQLLFDGLTRELPLIGFVEGVWMVGAVDEIRMPVTETERSPALVDTKTREQATLPAEPQRRNGRLQLMCYKNLWDNLVADNFPSRRFFNFFSLNPHCILDKEIRENAAKAGFPAQTLDDIVRYFRNSFRVLPRANDQLLLRYESQEDNSLLGEDQFMYDSDWLKSQIQSTLEFWLGERESKFTPEEERWKCNYCQFASDCPVNTTNSN